MLKDGWETQNATKLLPACCVPIDATWSFVANIGHSSGWLIIIWANLVLKLVPKDKLDGSSEIHFKLIELVARIWNNRKANQVWVDNNSIIVGSSFKLAQSLWLHLGAQATKHDKHYLERLATWNVWLDRGEKLG